MDKIDEIVKARKVAHGRLIKDGSKVYKAFLAMEEAAFSDGALPKKAKELIAVGISVVIDCESCMQWHIEQAGKAGASRAEIYLHDMIIEDELLNTILGCSIALAGSGCLLVTLLCMLD